MLTAIAKVAVDKAAYEYDMPYRYEIPPFLATKLKSGCRVLVPFGRGNRKRVGIVLATLEEELPSRRGLKAVSSLVEEDIILSREMLELVVWLKEQTFCTYFEAVRTLLPSGLGVRCVPRYYLAAKQLPADLTEEERALCGFLLTAKTQREFDALLEDSEQPGKKSVIEALLRRGVIAREDNLKRRVGDKTIRMVRLTERFLSGEQPAALTPKQRKIAELLQDAGSASITEVCYICGVTEAVIRTMQQREVLEQYEYEVLRSPHSPIATDREGIDSLTLSPSQQQVFEGLREQLQTRTAQAALLHGVTGSGKTSVFQKLIAACLAEGRSAIMLVPEISLTPQMLGQFRQLFGDTVAVMHSSLSLGQRVDEYKRIRNGQARIVVGTRSAVFAPLADVGVIILDEEGEHTYKSEASPRYHAREVAKWRCARHGALMLLASATPSIESYHAAQTGKYHLYELSERYSDALLPEVFMVDMRPELSAGNDGSFSQALLEEMRYNLENGEQTILLLNRRGYHTYITCMSCGEPLTCPNCSVALTYHKTNGQVMCHYCGYSRDADTVCPSCASPHLRHTGAGTQRIEDEILTAFPEARILRMDADSTGSRYAFEKGFADFGAGNYDILLGTQMIAKGLDFPRVTLVGVLSVDKALYAGDFRSYERTFSLITQVVGRSGRGDRPGRAYIQTFTPEHYVLELAARQDYRSFFDGEIEIRKALLYPPFCDLCVIGFSSLVEAAAASASQRFLTLMRQHEALSDGSKIPLRALGPAKCTMGKIGGRFRYRLILKCRNTAAFRRVIADTLIRAGKDREFANVSMTADMNGDIG